MTESLPLPDPRLADLSPLFLEKLASECRAFTAGGPRWRGVFDPTMSALFDLHLREAGADEGTIWLLDREREALIPTHNNGPRGAAFVGTHLQPLSRGIVSTVFSIQSGVAESWVHRNTLHDPAANTSLGVVTVHMIATPFYFGGETRGVISAVKLRKPGAAETDDPPPFHPGSLGILHRLAFVLGELVDARVLRTLIGLR